MNPHTPSVLFHENITNRIAATRAIMTTARIQNRICEKMPNWFSGNVVTNWIKGSTIFLQRCLRLPAKTQTQRLFLLHWLIQPIATSA